jgi:hypothetical protein
MRREWSEEGEKFLLSVVLFWGVALGIPLGNAQEILLHLAASCGVLFIMADQTHS